MIPYVASYIAMNFDRHFNNGLVVWMTAAPFLTQGLFMTIGGILAPRFGVRAVVISGSVICR